jgi:hypothetical protein
MPLGGLVDVARRDELKTSIVSMATRLAAATGEWLTMIAELDRNDWWGESGIVSCAHWLSFYAGVSLHAAREHVRVARALDGLPKTRAALCAGELSYSKARAISRVATAEDEHVLVDIAQQATAAQLDYIVSDWERSDRLSDVTDRFERQRVSYHWDEDGSFVLRARFTPEDGAIVRAAIERAREIFDPKPDSRDHDDTPDLSKAQALVGLMTAWLQTEATPEPGRGVAEVVVVADVRLLDGGEAAMPDLSAAASFRRAGPGRGSSAGHHCTRRLCSG